MAARRKDVNTRIGIEVKQKDAENRRQFRKLQNWARQTQKQLDRIGAFAKRIGLGLGGVLTAAAALYAKQERAERKLRGALKHTNQEVDRLFKKYKKLASDIQSTTTFGDEDLLGAASTLTRLAQISEEQMPSILELTADWATFLDKDVNSAARDIGRVMADPVKNLTLMGRYGVQVTDGLKEQLRILQETGREEEARLMVMNLLHAKVGGLSRELANTNVGKWVQLKNLAGDILEIVGERLLKQMRPVADFLTALAKKILDNRDAVGKLADKLIYAFQVAISAAVIASVLGLLLKVRVGIAALGIAASAARLKFALMWGGLTLGLSLAVPFIVSNWNKIVETFRVSGILIKGFWDNVIDNIMWKWESFASTFEQAWIGLQKRWFPDRPAPEASVKVRPQPMSVMDFGRYVGDAYADDMRRIWGAGGGETAPEIPGLGDGPGDGSGGGPGGGPGPGGDPDEAAEEAERRRQEEIEASRERDRQVTEGFLQGMQRQRKARWEAAKQVEKDAKKEMSWMDRLRAADRTGLLQRGRYWTKFHELKARLDKLAAVRELLMALASQPARAFSQTYANLGWPLGAIMGIVAQVATYAQIFAGLSSIRSMSRGGLARGGIQGKDSIPAMLKHGELVTPPESYDEHIDAVAQARDSDLAAAEGGDTTVVLELDGSPIAEWVIEKGKRNRAFA